MGPLFKLSSCTTSSGCAEIQKSLEVYLPSFGIGYRLAILGR